MDNNTNDIYNIDFDELGSVKISSEVVAAVASLAAREVRGIADMGNSAGVLGDLLGKKTYKGVRCEIKDKTTSIDMLSSWNTERIFQSLQPAAGKSKDFRGDHDGTRGKIRQRLRAGD